MKALPPQMNRRPYEPNEIKEILDHARKLAVRFIKIEGFGEVTWALEPIKPEPPMAEEPEPRPPEAAPTAHQKGWETAEGPRRAAELCKVCGEEKRPGRFGRPYCVRCFIAKKEGGK